MSKKESRTSIQGKGSAGGTQRRAGACWQRYQVHPNQITEWKKQPLEHAPEVFSKGRKAEQGPSAKDLHVKIGQLSMENDFLSGALCRIGDASAKR